VVRRAAVLLGLLGAGAVGCGLSDAGVNEVNGKRLFVERCGSCHVLDRAGTAGRAGPDLDAAFRRARADGLGESTIAGIVEGQIAHPGKSSAMPADLVTGEDAEDVAAYVAQAAAAPGEDQGRLADVGLPADAAPGLQVFVRSGCGSCHVLAEARASGTTGPNLDQTLEGRSEAYVREAIVAPDAVVAEGYRPGVMPGDYEKRLVADDLDSLVDYLADGG
jgi:mono/diheme cytochrome c family protein